MLPTFFFLRSKFQKYGALYEEPMYYIMILESLFFATTKKNNIKRDLEMILLKKFHKTIYCSETPNNLDTVWTRRVKLGRDIVKEFGIQELLDKGAKYLYYWMDLGMSCFGRMFWKKVRAYKG